MSARNWNFLWQRAADAIKGAELKAPDDPEVEAIAARLSATLDELAAETQRAHLRGRIDGLAEAWRKAREELAVLTPEDGAS